MVFFLKVFLTFQRCSSFLLVTNGNQWKDNYLYSDELDIFLIKAPDLMKKRLRVLATAAQP